MIDSQMFSNLFWPRTTFATGLFFSLSRVFMKFKNPPDEHTHTLPCLTANRVEFYGRSVRQFFMGIPSLWIRNHSLGRKPFEVFSIDKVDKQRAIRERIRLGLHTVVFEKPCPAEFLAVLDLDSVAGFTPVVFWFLRSLPNQDSRHVIHNVEYSRVAEKPNRWEARLPIRKKSELAFEGMRSTVAAIRVCVATLIRLGKLLSASPYSRLHVRAGLADS